MKQCKRVPALFLLVSLLLSLLLSGCGAATAEAASTAKTRIVATTYPVYYLVSEICADLPEFEVSALVQEPVSCLHNYSITTNQMKALDRADVVVLNGAGMEEFLENALQFVPEEDQIDSSAGIDLLPGEDEEYDPHIWLSPEKYAQQCDNITSALAQRYPEYAAELTANGQQLQENLNQLQTELSDALKDLQCRELITFHDGFSYFAQAFDLTIAAAVEEEEGAETPARELKRLCTLVETEQIPAVFAEKNGSDSACSVISSETGAPVYILNTMMDGETDYFTAMRQNVGAVREALS